MGMLLWLPTWRDTTSRCVNQCDSRPKEVTPLSQMVHTSGVEIAPLPMANFFTAEQLLYIAEDRATNGNPAVIGGIYSNDLLADFRHAVRTADVGAVLHIPGAMAQTDHFPCVGQLPDGTRLFQDYSHPGVDADDWARIVD